MGREFTIGDKVIYISSYVWIFIWTVVFAVGTVYNLTHDGGDAGWMQYWKYYVIIFVVVSAFVVVWFTIGGIIDMKSMFKQLSVMKRDDKDSGYLGEE